MDWIYYLSGGIWNILLIVAVVILFVKVSNLKESQEKILKKLEGKKVEGSQDLNIERNGEERYSFRKTDEVEKEISVEKTEEEKAHREYKIGAKIIPAIGIVSVLFGLAFFLKYTFDHNIIDETGRVILGFISGIIFVAVGMKLRKKYTAYGNLLMGSGFAILYLAAKFGLIYNLYPTAIAFILMVFVTAVAVLIAYKTNSKVVALTSLLGGFLVPILASGGGNELVLFNYILILLLGMFFLSWKRNWAWLIGGSALGTVILYSLSFAEYYSNEVFGIYWIYLFIYFAIFTVAPVLYFLNKGKYENYFWGIVNSALPLITGAIFMLTSYFMFKDMENGTLVYDGQGGGKIINAHPLFANIYFVIGLIPAIFYLVLSKIAIYRNRAGGENVLVYYFTALATFAIALIPALQFSGKWITFAWMLEALVLLVLALKTRQKEVFANLSIFVWAASIFRLLTLDNYIQTGRYEEGLGWVSDFSPIFNERFLIYFLGILTTFTMAYFFLKNAQLKRARVVAVIGNLLVLILLWIELKTSAKARIISYDMASLLISLSYIIYGGILMTIGLQKNYSGFRKLSIFIFAFVILKAYLSDIWEMSEIIRILAFIILGLATLLVGYYYSKNSDKIKSLWEK